MSEWVVKSIKDLGIVITGKTPSKNHPEDWGDEYCFITPSDYYTYNKYASSSIRYLSNLGANRQKNKLLPKYSLLVTCIGSDMGKVVINAKSVITNQQINALVPNKDIADYNFLYYLFKNSVILLKILGSDGTAVPILNKTDFENIEYLIPPLPEQKAIADVLSALDDKIDLLQRQNETLEKMAETLFRQWFIEEAKEDWEEVSVGDFGTVVCGKTPSKKNENYYGNDVPFLKIPDMHGNIFISATTDNLSLNGSESQIKKLLPKNSICVSCIATVGLVCINDIELHTNQQINSIVLDNNKYLYFLFLTMKNMYEELHNLASGGTATLNLNTGDFSKILISKPDEVSLEMFNEVAVPSFNKIRKNAQQIQTLKNMRDTLLPKLMSGEVRVKLD